MRLLLTFIVALSLLTLLSCNNDEIGGSSAPTVDISGNWLGTMTPDVVTEDNVVKFLQVDLRFQGSTPDDGSVVGDTRFCVTDGNVCIPVGFQNTCPEQRQNWASTMESADMIVVLRGSRSDNIDVQIEWSDSENGVGRYEYVGSEGVCNGETGDIVMRRPVS